MFLTDRRTVLVGLSSTLAAAALAQDMPVVETASGKLQGFVQDSAVAFFGIPYAAAPVGRLRYRAPQPAAPWAGIRDASKPGAASMSHRLFDSSALQIRQLRFTAVVTGTIHELSGWEGETPRLASLSPNLLVPRASTLRLQRRN